MKDKIFSLVLVVSNCVYFFLIYFGTLSIAYFKFIVPLFGCSLPFDLSSVPDTFYDWPLEWRFFGSIGVFAGCFVSCFYRLVTDFLSWGIPKFCSWLISRLQSQQ